MKRIEANESNSQFGQLLRSWRLKQNLTQAEVAPLLGVSIAQVSRLENGSRLPTNWLNSNLATLLHQDSSSENLPDTPNSVELPSNRSKLLPQNAELLTAVTVVRIGNATLHMRLECIPPDYDQADIDDIAEIVKRNAALTLRNYFRTRIRRKSSGPTGN